MKTYTLKEFKDIARVGMKVKIDDGDEVLDVGLITGNEFVCIDENELTLAYYWDSDLKVTLLSESEKTWETLEEGDAVWDNDGEKRMVLGRVGMLVAVSYQETALDGDGFITMFYLRHPKILEHAGFSLTPPKDTCSECGREKE